MELLSNTFDGVVTWFFGIFLLGLGAYWVLTKKHNYWKEAGIPYISAVPVMGSMTSAFIKPLHEIELLRYRAKGRFYGSYEGTQPVINIAEPDLLRDIMVKDFQFFPNRRDVSVGDSVSDNIVANIKDEDWKRVRTIITPTFTTGKIKRMTGIFIDSAKTLVDNFKKATKEDKPVDMKPMFGAFAMDVIASSAFATKLDSHNDPTNVFVTHAKEAFNSRFIWRAVMFFTMPKVMKLLGIGILPHNVMEFFRDVTLKIVEERKRSGKRRNDFLQMLMDAMKEGPQKHEESDVKDTATEMGHEEHNAKIFNGVYHTQTLSNDELVAQCVIFFIAGYETTASTLSFTAYELALNTNIQDRVIEEIDEVIREKGGLDYETIAEMKYLDKVVSETLRKYPPAVKAERVVNEDYYIKDHNITLPKEMIVSVPIFAIHRDPKNYPDPEKYDPERFSAEQKATRHSYTYIPFGAGPRNCIGMRFALMEIKVCLAYVLSQCRFRACSQTDVPLKYHLGGIGLLQAKKVVLKIELRDDAVQH